MKLLIIIGFLFPMMAFADVALDPGESISINGDKISCSEEGQITKSCYCSNRGCGTQTSGGSIILNIVHVNGNGDVKFRGCSVLSSETICVQAMAVCN